MPDKEKEVLQWDTWLVEAVRKIRTQKQRPGLDRIYNAVRLLAEKQELAEHNQKSPIAPIYTVQFNQIKIEQVQRHLDRAVGSGLLLKVYSKGQATYKAVEKSERTLNISRTKVGEENVELSKCILKVIRELSECDAPVPTSSAVTVSSLSTKSAKVGYTFDSIEEYVRHSHVIIYPDDPEEQFFPVLVRQALMKEVSKGKVECVDGTHFRLGSGGIIGGSPAPAASSKGKPDKVKKTEKSAPKKAASPAPTPSPPTVGGSVAEEVKIADPPAVGSESKKPKKETPIPAPVPPNSPPRLPLDMSEAEEIALVTEQTARAVKLVLKDRKPGDKPPHYPSSSSSSSSGGCSPKIKKSDLFPVPVIVEDLQKLADKASQQVTNTPSPSSMSGESSCGEDDKFLPKPKIEQLSDDSSAGSTSSRRSVESSDKSVASAGSKKETAVIKLMVPVIPGRNNGNKTAANTGNKSLPAPEGAKGDDKKGQSSPVNPGETPPGAQILQGKGAGGSLSISSIATAIMNKTPNTGKCSTDLKQCTLCQSAPAQDTLKDSNYADMVQLYYTVMGIDVKPQETFNTNFCPECFQSLGNLQQSQDMCVFFENYAKQCRLQLLQKIVKRSDNLDWMHREIIKIHGKDNLTAEETLVQMQLDQFTYDCNMDDVNETQ